MWTILMLFFQLFKIEDCCEEKNLKVKIDLTHMENFEVVFQLFKIKDCMYYQS